VLSRYYFWNGVQAILDLMPILTIPIFMFIVWYRYLPIFIFPISILPISTFLQLFWCRKCSKCCICQKIYFLVPHLYAYMNKMFWYCMFEALTAVLCTKEQNLDCDRSILLSIYSLIWYHCIETMTHAQLNMVQLCTCRQADIG
jgi:hypothetical protein